MEETLFFTNPKKLPDRLTVELFEKVLHFLSRIYFIYVLVNTFDLHTCFHKKSLMKQVPQQCCLRRSPRSRGDWWRGYWWQCAVDSLAQVLTVDAHPTPWRCDPHWRSPCTWHQHTQQVMWPSGWAVHNSKVNATQTDHNFTATSVAFYFSWIYWRDNQILWICRCFCCPV